MSQIEKSVSQLLVATKELLETLTKWSRQSASETDVSDVYVRLGYEFNLACRAFQSIGVNTSDLGPVPDMLRTILEDTLSQDALPESLEKYLPSIRDIIIKLLEGLKTKQARLRSRQQQLRNPKNLPPRRESSGSAENADNAAPHPVPDDPVAFMAQSPPATSPEPGVLANNFPESGVIRQSTSGERHGGSFAEREASMRDVPRVGAGSPQSSMQNISSASLPAPAHAPDGRSTRYSPQNFPHLPPPPPPAPSKQNDAIGLLQRSGELERRASRRFSAYQIQKQLGTPPSGMPVLPTSQQPPLPVRGREVRESMNAVRLRGSYLARQKAATDPNKRDQDQSGNGDSRMNRAVPRVRPSGDSISQHPSADRLHHSDSVGRDSGAAAAAAAMAAAADQRRPYPVSPQEEYIDNSFTTPRVKGEAEPTLPMRTHRYTPEPPSQNKELTLFLQYKSKIKKYVLPEGYTGLTIGRLQLAFIEKFAWNTHDNGADLPEIYIQDPASGIRHELEDLSDVRDRSVLVLNVEPLDEVKKHFDEQVKGVKSLLKGVQSLIETQSSTIQQMNDHQQATSKEIARLAVPLPREDDLPTNKTSILTDESRPTTTSAGPDEVAEIRSVRRDLAVLRQIYTAFTSDISNSMTVIRKKAEGVKSVAADTTTPVYEGDAGRAHINAGKKTLSDESEKLVKRVDDLQDLVEDLRKDVVTRGVRPLPRQLEAVGRDIVAVTKELKKMQDFLKKEKPVWTKIWEKELQMVCEERDQLTMQEDLAVDLEDDLEKASQTFALVEQATKQQNNQANNSIGTRSLSRGMLSDHVTDLAKVKDSVLGEVKALQPNHQNRLDAIERAEKARQKELEDRRVGKFQKELGSFVQEGKLKKSGGIDETERMRKLKDEQNRREAWELENARKEELNATANPPPASNEEGPTPPSPQTPPGDHVEEESAPSEEKTDGPEPEKETEPDNHDETLEKDEEHTEEPADEKEDASSHDA